jgi:long-chain acyl-CoA synthetase
VAHVFLESRPPPTSLRSSETDGTFFIGFTSGTTSTPKAFLRSRPTWRRSLELSREIFRLDSGSSVLAPGSMAFGVTMYAMVEAFDTGASFATMPSFDALRVASLLREEPTSRLVLVPSMLTALARAESAGRAQFAAPSVRQVVTAGSKLEPHHVETAHRLFPQAELIEYYGASEFGFVTFNRMGSQANNSNIETVGRPFPTVELAITDDAGNIVGPGEIGTIHVRSNLVADGYLWGDDGQSFRETPHGVTVGDLGYLDSAGALTLVGRAGQMMVVNGNNVYPSEVEATLKRFPSVADAVVYGRPDRRIGSRPIAVISMEAGGRVDTEELVAWCSRWLPRHKVPREIHVVDEWPVTSNGKLLRERLIAAVEGHAVQP